MDQFQVRQGTELALVVALIDGNGNPITTYTGTEALTATVWPGGSFPSALHPTISWSNAALGLLNLAISPSQTTTLGPGRFRLTVDLTDPTNGILEAYEALVEVNAAPGTSTTGLLYCTNQDLARFGRGWFARLLQEDEGAGFQLEIDGASRRLDDLIISRYPTRAYTILGDPGYGSIVWGGGSGALPSQWLRGILAGGGLVLRAKVVESVAKWALSEIAKGQIGIGDSAKQYAILGRRYENEAAACAQTMVAEISTDGSGNPTIGIALTGTSLRPWYT